MLDPFFLGSARYGVGVLLFIAILWIAEGRQALRYGGRFLPAAVYGLFGFTAFNTFVWWGLAYTRPEHASIIMALQTPMVALAVWLTRGMRPRPFTIGCIAVAIGVPDEKSGEVPKLFIVKKDPSLTEAQVLAHCKAQLTGYKQPKHVEFRTELPKTNVGKILRRALRDEKKAA